MPVDKRNSDQISACAAVGEQLSAYIDGELSEDDAAAVEAHLRDCPDCAKLCSALRTLRVDLAGAQLDPPPELHTRIMACVHRENRLRRLRRITAAASVSVAAMFCFVVIGGAMLRTGTDGASMEAAPNNAPKLMAQGAEAEQADGIVHYSLADAAMTGGVIDTTLVAEPTIVGTGIDSDTANGAPLLHAVGPETTAAPNTTKAPETTAAPETRAPETRAPATTALTTPAETGVLSAKLPDALRDLSRLAGTASIQGLSTTCNTAEAAFTGNTAAAPDSLAAISGSADARLAEEQIGTLCTVELDDGLNGIRYLVYDLVTGSRLTLAEFLGDTSAPAALGAEADTPYRPTAAGLCLLLPTGEKCIAWSENDTLSACVTRYAMTKPPLCGVE